MSYTKGTFKDGTKGWKAVPYKNLVGFATHEIHWSDDGECIAEVVHGEKDAKLIAAAPDLLEALQEFLKVINRTPTAMEHYGNAIKLGEAAINKATH